MTQPDLGDNSVLVGDIMSEPVLTVAPDATLREAARQMARRRLGAAVVRSRDGETLSIITERDLLISLGVGEDPDGESVGARATHDVVFALRSWTIAEAAVTMIRGDFRHLVVVDGAEAVGVLSLRDIMRTWTQDGEIVAMPATVSLQRSAADDELG